MTSAYASTPSTEERSAFESEAYTPAVWHRFAPAVPQPRLPTADSAATASTGQPPSKGQEATPPPWHPRRDGV